MKNNLFNVLTYEIATYIKYAIYTMLIQEHQ